MLINLRTITSVFCILSYLCAFAQEEPDTVLNETLLDDFVVVEQRKLVQSDGATLTYNVSDDPESATSGVLDILRKVPGVTVDSEDNVRVNGKTNFRILVNNREDPMFSGDIKNILKSMPAASIKKIEVISEPGAKYDAEGAGGILNFVLENKNRFSGWTANLGAWLNNRNAGASVSARTQINKVMIGADISYNSAVFPQPSLSWSTETIDLESADGEVVTMNSKSRTNWKFFNPRLNMSWEADSLNLFTLSLSYGDNPYSQKSYGTYRGLIRDNELLWSLSRRMRSDATYRTITAQASYQHSFGRPDNNLVFSYLLFFKNHNSPAMYYLDEQTGRPDTPPVSQNLSDGRNTTHVVQADYSNQFNSKFLFESGAKVNLDNSPTMNESLTGASAGALSPLAGSKMDFSQFRDIYSLYASTTANFSKINLKAGLRYEHTYMGMKYRTEGWQNFSSRLNDIVPNAAVSYRFTDASTLRAAYQMRISRPGVNLIDPFTNTLIPGEISYGNPDLKSSKNHNVSLGYSNYDHDVSGELKVEYSYTSNAITDVIFMKDGLRARTYANVGHDSYLQTNLYLSWRISRAVSWSWNASLSYIDLKADSELLKASNHGWQGFISSNVNATLPNKFSLSAYGGGYTPWIDLQSKGSGGYYYGLSVKRKFLRNDALELSLSANNILPATRHNQYTQKSPSVIYHSRNEYKGWSVGLGLSWRFGSLKSDVKKTAASVDVEGQAATRR